MVVLTSTIYIKPSPSPARCCRSSTLGHCPNSSSSPLEVNFLFPSSFSFKSRLLILPVHNLHISTICLIRYLIRGSITWCCWKRNWSSSQSRAVWFSILTIMAKYKFQQSLQHLISMCIVSMYIEGKAW